MINLLPPEVKEDILYARRNVVLLRWCGAMLLSTIALLAIVFAGQLYMNKAIASYSTQVALSTEQLKTQKLEETQKRVTEFSANLQLGIQVLSRQVVYSDLLRQLGNVLPAGTILNDLRVTKLEGGIDLQFNTRDEHTATLLQDALKNPDNKVFEKADILSINCPKSSLDPNYPCRVSIRALFNKSNPFLITSRLATTGAKQ
jgi:Tfp pilus assembly protein PilN